MLPLRRALQHAEEGLMSLYGVPGDAARRAHVPSMAVTRAARAARRALRAGKRQMLRRCCRHEALLREVLLNAYAAGGTAAGSRRARLRRDMLKRQQAPQMRGRQRNGAALARAARVGEELFRLLRRFRPPSRARGSARPLTFPPG